MSQPTPRLIWMNENLVPVAPIAHVFNLTLDISATGRSSFSASIDIDDFSQDYMANQHFIGVTFSGGDIIRTDQYVFLAQGATVSPADGTVEISGLDPAVLLQNMTPSLMVTGKRTPYFSKGRFTISTSSNNDIVQEFLRALNDHITYLAANVWPGGSIPVVWKKLRTRFSGSLVADDPAVHDYEAVEFFPKWQDIIVANGGVIIPSATVSDGTFAYRISEPSDSGVYVTQDMLTGKASMSIDNSDRVDTVNVVAYDKDKADGTSMVVRRLYGTSPLYDSALRCGATTLDVSSLEDKTTDGIRKAMRAEGLSYLNEHKGYQTYDVPLPASLYCGTSQSVKGFISLGSIVHVRTSLFTVDLPVIEAKEVWKPSGHNVTITCGTARPSNLAIR